MLFPTPHEVLRHDPDLRCTGPVEVVPGGDLPPQGFELTITPERTTIRAVDDAGQRYGRAALDQLRGVDGSYPSAHVRDWPDVAVRGYMLDVSRCRVPTRDTLTRLVEVLALARYNHLELYVEHTFAHPGHEEVWGDASPLTGEDLAWLDEVYAAAGLELVVNQNTFGHMERWLRHEPYRSHAECPDGWDLIPGVHRRPSVLAPTADNATFAVGLVREQARHVRSNTVHIGGDEPFELGRGVSADLVGRRGLGRVYLDHLRRIAEPLVADGHTVLHWGDVARSHPELLGELPITGAIPVAWTYEAPRSEPLALDLPDRVLDALGLDLSAHAGFAANVAPFVEHDVPFWVAPGTSTWNSLVGRFDNARANLLDGARTALDTGAGGLLVTDWGDNGHHQPPAISVPPILYGGAVAWWAEGNHDRDVTSVIDELVYRDEHRRIGTVLGTIGELWGRTGLATFNASPLQAGLFPHQGHPTGGTIDPDAVRWTVQTLDDSVSSLTQSRPGSPDGRAAVDEVTVACRLARHGALRLLARAGEPGLDAETLRHDLGPLVTDHERAWLARSRPGGLAESRRHLERTLSGD